LSLVAGQAEIHTGVGSILTMNTRPTSLLRRYRTPWLLCSKTESAKLPRSWQPAAASAAVAAQCQVSVSAVMLAGKNGCGGKQWMHCITPTSCLLTSISTAWMRLSTGVPCTGCAGSWNSEVRWCYKGCLIRPSPQKATDRVNHIEGTKQSDVGTRAVPEEKKEREGGAYTKFKQHHAALCHNDKLVQHVGECIGSSHWPSARTRPPNPRGEGVYVRCCKLLRCRQQQHQRVQLHHPSPKSHHTEFLLPQCHHCKQLN